ILILQVTAHRQTERCRDRGAGVACSKYIIWALITSQIARKATKLTNGVKAVTAACQEFMPVGLVANIPDQQVTRGVEDKVENYCQFNGAQVRGQMSTFHRNSFDDFASDLAGQLLHLRRTQGAQ